MKKSLGYSLIEVLVAIVAITIFILAIGTVVAFASRSQSRQIVLSSMGIIRSNVKNALSNDAVWQRTVSAAHNSDSFNCINSGTGCRTQASADPQPFYLYDVLNNPYTEYGFKRTGLPCSQTEKTNTPDECLISVVLTWKPYCATTSVDATCTRPLIQIYGTINTTISGTAFNSINNGNFTFNMARQSLAQLCVGWPQGAGCPIPPGASNITSGSLPYASSPANPYLSEVCTPAGWVCETQVFECPPAYYSWTLYYTNAVETNKPITCSNAAINHYTNNGVTTTANMPTSSTIQGSKSYYCNGTSNPGYYSAATNPAATCYEPGFCGSAANTEITDPSSLTSAMLCTGGTANPSVLTSANFLAADTSWNWTCVGRGVSNAAVGDAACKAYQHYDGQCGPASTKTYSSLPTDPLTLCSSGPVTPAPTATATGWTWQCGHSALGSPSGICSATKSVGSPGVCGTSNGTASNTAPTGTGLCNSGSSYAFNESTNTWLWVCTTNPANPSDTSAYSPVCSTHDTSKDLVNGGCGSVASPNGPWSNISAGDPGLCSAGTSTAPTNDGTNWHWSCNGQNGGSSASCQAGYQGGSPSSPPTPPSSCTSNPGAAGCPCPAGFSGTMPTCSATLAYGSDSCNTTLTCDGSGNCSYSGTCKQLKCTNNTAPFVWYVTWGVNAPSGVNCTAGIINVDGCGSFFGSTYSGTSASCTATPANPPASYYQCSGSGAGSCSSASTHSPGTLGFTCSGTAGALVSSGTSQMFQLYVTQTTGSGAKVDCP